MQLDASCNAEELRQVRTSLTTETARADASSKLLSEAKHKLRFFAGEDKVSISTEKWLETLHELAETKAALAEAEATLSASH